MIDSSPGEKGQNKVLVLIEIQAIKELKISCPVRGEREVTSATF
jgi:hypothetical protein